MNQTKEEGLKRQIKHLQEEIDNLKQDSSSKNQSFVNQSRNQSTEPQKQQAKKLPDGLHHRRPTTKCRNHKCYKFYRINHANTKKLWGTVEDTTGHKFDPIGNVINLSNKTFTTETFQLLNKNLTSYLHQIYLMKLN